MKNNMRYWTIGILAAVIVLVIAGFALGNRTKNKNQDQTLDAAQSQSETQKDDPGAHSAGEAQNHNLDHVSSEDSVNRYLQKQDQIMADMTQAMKSIPKSGSASVDFLNGMIPHHESAIDMAEAYLSYGGENEKLKDMAQNMITVQKEEISQMKDLAADYQKEGHQDQDKENAYLAEYDSMMDHDHEMSKSGASSLEHAFAEGMILHHQMAVDMAKSILEYTDYEEIKTLARNIVKAQEEEIEEMKEFIH